MITIVDHDYKTGEKVKYTCTGTPISGLSVNTEYYVTTVDKDTFHLSQIGFLRIENSTLEQSSMLTWHLWV